MNERLNRTSICSVMFLDIVSYSTCTDAEQIALKDQFNRLINEAIKDVAQSDRILLDSGDGAAIALLGAPEEALFIAMTIRNGIETLNQGGGQPLQVRIGINLGPVRVVKDINGRPNIIGDGINVAQRVMSFAEPNQILVSRSYYEVTSRLTKEFSDLFTYSGIKQDKHVREHEVYAIGAYHPPSGAAAVGSMASAQGADSTATAGNRRRRLVVLAGVLALALIVLAAVMFMAGNRPQETEDGMMTSSRLPGAPAFEEEIAVRKQDQTTEKSQQDEIEKNTDAVKKAEPSKRTEASKKAATPQKTGTTSSATSSPEESGTAAAEPDKSTEKSGWDTFKESVKQGGRAPSSCTEVERMLNQCQ